MGGVDTVPPGTSSMGQRDAVRSRGNGSVGEGQGSHRELLIGPCRAGGVRTSQLTSRPRWATESAPPGCLCLLSRLLGLRPCLRSWRGPRGHTPTPGGRPGAPRRARCQGPSPLGAAEGSCWSLMGSGWVLVPCEGPGPPSAHVSRSAGRATSCPALKPWKPTLPSSLPRVVWGLWGTVPPGLGPSLQGS